MCSVNNVIKSSGDRTEMYRADYIKSSLPVDESNGNCACVCVWHLLYVEAI